MVKGVEREDMKDVSYAKCLYLFSVKDKKYNNEKKIRSAYSRIIIEFS